MFHRTLVFQIYNQILSTRPMIPCLQLGGDRTLKISTISYTSIETEVITNDSTKGRELIDSYVKPLMNDIKEFAQSMYSSLTRYSLRDRMKTKNFYLLVLFILATGTTLWLLANPSPNFHTIVSETHKQLTNIKNIPSNIRSSIQENLDVAPTYLEALGFSEDGNTSSRKVQTKNIAVVATSVEPGAYGQVQKLMKSVTKYLPGKHLVIFDLGLSGGDALKLKKHCNTTHTCSVRKFRFDKYPSHVRDLYTHSYRPICIQEVLKEYGAVIWADPSEVFLSSEISSSIQQAQESGISAWNNKELLPTSALTHPKMFKFFHTDEQNFFFHRAIKSSHLIIYNTAKIHKEIMLPWVKCALVADCIAPFGSQNVGCSLKWPRFKYTGCHKYDMSALNVILGIQFNYEVDPYESKDKVFGVLTNSGNTTVPVRYSEDFKTKSNQVLGNQKFGQDVGGSSR